MLNFCLQVLVRSIRDAEFAGLRLQYMADVLVSIPPSLKLPKEGSVFAFIIVSLISERCDMGIEAE